MRNSVLWISETLRQQVYPSVVLNKYIYSIYIYIHICMHQPLWGVGGRGTGPYTIHSGMVVPWRSTNDLLSDVNSFFLYSSSFGFCHLPVGSKERKRRYEMWGNPGCSMKGNSTVTCYQRCLQKRKKKTTFFATHPAWLWCRCSILPKENGFCQRFFQLWSLCQLSSTQRSQKQNFTLACSFHQSFLRFCQFCETPFI